MPANGEIPPVTDKLPTEPNEEVICGVKAPEDPPKRPPSYDVIEEAHKKFLALLGDDRRQLPNLYPVSSLNSIKPANPLIKPERSKNTSVPKPASVRQTKIDNLRQVLSNALNKNTIQELKDYLTAQSKTETARLQSVWRFLGCLWRPKSQTQGFLEKLAESLEPNLTARDALIKALARHKYRGLEFFTPPPNQTVDQIKAITKPGRIVFLS